MKIIDYKLPAGSYNTQEYPKTQIYLHHTAGNSNPYGVVDYWGSVMNKIATAYIIGGKPSTTLAKYSDGDIIQCFDPDQWAYHLGLQTKTFASVGVKYSALDRTSIGIEVCNWGCITRDKNGVFYTYVKKPIESSEVLSFDKPYRGFNHYHKYTDAQIESLRKLLLFLCDKYKIPKTYNQGMWDISKDALSGKPGIYNHTSVRTDKTDMSPQPKLIEMLKSLSK